jgi:hypothetical protein
MAGHVELECRKVEANFPFERSHRFAGVQPKSGFGDYSRLSCGVGDTQLGRRPGSRQGCLRGCCSIAECRGCICYRRSVEETAHLALDLVFVCLHGAALLNYPPRKKGVPARDFISAERKFTEVCAFARPLAELVAPPTMRHHAETSSTMIADLRLPHPILAQQFEGSCLRAWESQSCSSSSR